MSKLSELLWYELSDGLNASSVQDATDSIKALMLVLIGEDEDYFGGTAEANSINDRIVHRRNRLRSELRQKVEAL